MFMIMAGVMHLIQGLAAVVNSTFYVVGPAYTYRFAVSTWGWIHLIAGVGDGGGFRGLRGAVWARTVGIVLACVNIIASFMWIPYAPVWSITVIAFDAFVIWALTAHGCDIAAS